MGIYESAGASTRDAHRIIIVGSGFSGLGMAIQLKQAGIDDFLVLEKEAGVGGTVTKVLVENGQAVEFGQPLFVIE